MKDYSDMTNTDFAITLAEVIDSEIKKPSQLLTIPGVYEICSEEFNNHVLSAWEEKKESRR